MKTARRQAREIALQALYAGRLSGSDPVEQARSLEGFDKTDASFVNALASVYAIAPRICSGSSPASRSRVRPAFANRAGDPLHRRLRARRAPPRRRSRWCSTRRSSWERASARPTAIASSTAFWRRLRRRCARTKWRARERSPERIRDHPRFFERPPKHAVLGVGDDCALLAARAGFEIAVTTDMLIEGRHFPPGADARALGHKALAVSLSDLAGDGCLPALGDARHCLACGG